LNESQISKFLFTFEGIGVILAGSFLIAYLLAGSFLIAYLSGLPTNVVNHSDPTLRIVLSIFGGVAIILVFAGLLISKFTKRD